VQLARNWNWFWFQPADPRLLGLIRLFAGLLTFYVCLAYTVDLQEFFGANAWVDLKALHEFRYEIPYRARSFDWSDAEQIRPFPPDPENYAYEYEYIEKYGLNPRQFPTKGYDAFSIWYYVTDPTWMTVIHFCILTIVFLFAIGFCTRITSVLAWLGMVGYSHRAPTTLFGMDTMMNLLLLYLMVGPSGAAFSVDRLIMRYWATWRALRARRPAPMALAPAPRVSANIALRCMQFNLCLIYFTSGVSKLQGTAWWSGVAIWGTVANPEFSPIHYEWFMNSLAFLCRHRWLWELSMTAGATMTLGMEIGFPFLVWFRAWRWVMITLAVMMHTGIAIFMGLNTFSLMMMGLLLSFVPPETVNWLVQLPSRGARHLRLVFSGRSRPQVRAASIVRALDAWDQVRLLELSATRKIHASGDQATARDDAPPSDHSGLEHPAADGDHLRLITPEGEVRTGYALWEELVRSLRLLLPLRPLIYLPGIRGLGTRWFPPTIHEMKVPIEPAAEKPKSRNEKVTR
jgi:hypothetical protein